MSVAVLLSCHGTVASAADLPAFLANIRRGRPAPPELVRDVATRLERIGGSPLMRITGEQAAALEKRLGGTIPVRVAARLWHPYPSEAIDALVSRGARTIVSLPLAPQSVHVYHEAVRDAAARRGAVEVVCVPAWGTEPSLVEAFVECIDEALARLDPAVRGEAPIVLTAHSLPRRVLDAGDPYERQFREMAGAVAALLRARGAASPTRVAFQSQGASTEPWLGPDLASTLAEVAREGARAVVVAPIGFLAEHLETLYDLDIEARDIASRLGIERFERAPAPNARPRFIDALESVARRAIQPSA